MVKEIDIERLRRQARKAGYSLKRTPCKKVRLSIQLEEPNYVKLKELAEAQGKSMNKFLNGLIEKL